MPSHTHNFKEFPELTNAQMTTLYWDSPHKQITSNFDCKVIKVTDGDTIRVSTSFRDFDFPIRFIGIDAPEMNEGGAVARDWLKAQIEKSTVEIKINAANRVGKFGRLIGDVISRGMSMSDMQLRLGLAEPFGKKQEAEIKSTDIIFSLKQWF